MSTTGTAELCRLTVIGPDGRADLAVPVSTPLAALLPVFVRHTVDAAEPADDEPGSWVLQRLGEPPLDPDGTPETLDWLEGEQLYLRPALDPLPELHYDDLADGIATVVRTRRDRWRPEFDRPLYLTLSGLAAAVIAAVLLVEGPAVARTSAAAVVGVLFLAGAVVTGRTRPDLTVFATVAGLAGCGFAGLAGVIGTGEAATSGLAVVLSGGLAAVAAAVLVVGRLLFAPALALPPLVAVLLVCGALLGRQWLGAGFDLSAAQAGGLLAAVFLTVVIFAPKIALRAAHMRGPQLPRDAEELQYDVEPAPAEQVHERTVDADGYLSAVTVSVAVVFVAAFPALWSAGTWAGPVLTVLLGSAALLRARTFRSVWQRLAMTAAGVTGLVIAVTGFAGGLSPAWRGALLFGLLLVLYALVQAMLRPPPRRPLPVWGHLANIADTLVGLAVYPVLLQLLGVYAWVRGLGG